MTVIRLQDSVFYRFFGENGFILGFSKLQIGYIFSFVRPNGYCAVGLTSSWVPFIWRWRSRDITLH